MAGLDPATQKRCQVAEGGVVRIDQAYVYIMSNKRYGTIYVGVTNNIVRRLGAS